MKPKPVIQEKSTLVKMAVSSQKQSIKNFSRRTGLYLNTVVSINKKSLPQKTEPKPGFLEPRNPIKSTNLSDFALQLANS